MSGSPWHSTYAFRRFRSKHTELSQIYWTFVLAADALTEAVKSAGPNDFAPKIVGGRVTSGQLPLLAADVPARLSSCEDRVRLMLLVMCAANLEAYINEAVHLHLSGLGYGKDLISLTAVGQALGAPVLQRASLPEPLRYAEELFGVKYGPNLALWNRGYKLRCAMAHNGGVVTKKVLRDVPDLGMSLHERIGISWAELIKHLGAADDIAAASDRVVARPEVYLIEARQELSELRTLRRLPAKKRVWTVLNEEYGMPPFPSAAKTALLAEFYP